MEPTQQALATAGFELHRKGTRRDELLAQTDKVVPWAKLYALVEPRCIRRAGRPWTGANAADPFPAAEVQSVGPGGGRGRSTAVCLLIVVIPDLVADSCSRHSAAEFGDDK
jgi:hypothetical protein